MNRSRAAQINNYREFSRHLQENYSLTFHMAAIFAPTVLCGVVINNWLYYFSVHTMTVRYPLTVALSYLCFLIFTRVWANIMSEVENLGNTERSNLGTAGALLVSGFMGAQANNQAEASMYRNQQSILQTHADPGTVVDSADAVFSIGDLFSGLDEGALILLVIAFFGLLAALCGGSVIYYGADTLPEVLFQFGLAQKSPATHHPESWLRPAIVHTWKAFVGMAVMALLIGVVSLEACPTATRMNDVWESCTTAKQPHVVKALSQAVESQHRTRNSKR
jgi:hypothetical protein